MNNEIKEILARLSRCVITPDVRHDFDDLLDYITNLQEENEELNDSITWWNNRFNAVQRDYEDYKSRIEKAVEYIEHSKFIKEQVIMKSNYDMQDFQVKELLNILNGKSDE